MRSFLWSRRRRPGNLISVPAGEQRPGPISILGFAAGIFIGLFAACGSGHAQVNGMPNSAGPGPAVRAPHTNASAQRAEVVGTGQGAKIKITAQHVQTRTTPLRSQRIALVRRPPSKPASSSTVGSHTPAKPTKLATEKPTKLATPKTATPVAAPAKTAMPMPGPELLATPSQPDCTFDPARTDADDRQKLDYERQCYRHAEMIIRDRLKRLQGNVEEMIKAAKSTERVSASR